MMSIQHQRAKWTHWPSDSPQYAGDPDRFVPLITLVLCLGSLAVSVAGLLLKYPRPQRTAQPPAPAAIQSVTVDVSQMMTPQPEEIVGNKEAAPLPDVSPPLPQPQVPPPPPDLADVSSAPPLAALAVPSPAIAFAVPVDQPGRIVEPQRAAPVPHAVSTPPVAKTTSPLTASTPRRPTRIVYGEGDGLQPPPQYPREAVVARVEGTVLVRMTVRTDGSVERAEISKPCSSALLNQAAVRAVRETWRFRSGPVREYEVAIQFQLQSR